jgi:hypothetical protein
MMVATPAKKAVPAKSLSSILGDKKTDDKEPVNTESLPPTEREGYTRNDDGSYVKKDDKEPYLSPEVVATVPNKTPAELASETPDETAARYGINTEISDEDANNPRVQSYRDTRVRQVPSSTHLHPDIAKDNFNRGIVDQGTDNAQVRRVVSDTYDFAPDAEHNDKWDDSAVKEKQRKELEDENEYDRDEDYVDDDEDGTHKL